LVKQNPDDEPASALIERIRAEKQRLVKEGKIKKDKTESLIYRGADNSYYEKIGTVVKCIDDEIPFEIPDSWRWVRLENIIQSTSGGTPERTNPDYWKGDINWLKSGELNDGYIEEPSKEKITTEGLNNSSAKLFPKGTLLIALYGATTGKLGILNYKSSTNQAICGFFESENLETKYLFYFFMSLREKMIADSWGQAQPNISQSYLKNLCFPLPPIVEQQRIINQIENIELLLAEYDKHEKKEAQLTTDFPDKLKKSILQFAIQGKLVTQNFDDEPTSVLLGRIRKEKEKLIKAGKLKHDKNESFIYKDAADNSYYESRNGKVLCIDDEIPFKIPDNWAWCRLGNIAQHNTGKTLDKERNKGILRRYITTSNLYWGYFDLTETRQMPFKEEELERCTAQKGDLLICEGGEAGRSAIWDSENSICFQNHIHRVRPYVNISSEYILRFMGKINLSGEINIYRKGVGIKGLSGNALASILIPLPPLNEQNRIIKKIDQLFAVLS
jgi:type I restriction enzyme S subunit